MCGIAGVLGGTDPATLARQMSAALAHRGPDDEGMAWLSRSDGSRCGAFAHRRLAIIDLSAAGHQPMASGDARWSVVFNGEIYNYQALARELRDAGVRLRSGSDTEVLVEGFARQGPSFLTRLRGMYAAAIWDSHEALLYLMRDPFGIKPLYVARRDGGLLFASELRALLAAGVERRVAPDAVRSYLAWGSVPEPITMVAGVETIAAGTCVRFSAGDTQGFTASTVPAFASQVEPIHDRRLAIESVRDALHDSVRHHLVSDVPVALFLSGGIDSSAVVALAAQHAQQPLETFTITFGESAFDESVPARAVAQRFGTRHHEIPLTAAELLAALPHALASMDQPSMDGLNTYAVSKAVRDHGLNVVLSGLGGDELFAGYPSFRRASRIAPPWNATSRMRAAAASLATRRGLRGEKLALMLRAAHPAAAAYRASRALFAGTMLDALRPGIDPFAQCAPPAGLSLLNSVSWLEATGYMRDTLLRDSDVFSMTHGLELRVPFVDPAVAAAALAVPDTFKLERGRAKPVLVDALGDLLPREVWDRPKQGFVLPFDHWMRGPLQSDVRTALMSPARLERIGVDPAAAGAVWEGFAARRAGMSWSRPWALYTLLRWAEETGAAVHDIASAPAGRVAN